MNTARTLRKFREALGLSRLGLSQVIGRSPSTWEKYEAILPDDLIQDLVNYANKIGRADLGQELLDGLESSPAKDSVPIAEQEIVCPACESTLYVNQSGTANLVHGKSVPFVEKKTGNTPTVVQSTYIKRWIDLATRAITVRDRRMRRMLRSIESQMELVAEHAEEEKVSEGSGPPNARVDPVGATGKTTGRSTRGPRKAIRKDDA